MEVNIKTLSNSELNENILSLARSERKITHQILHYINEIELRKLFLSEGYNSMFDYLVKKIGYCESAAYRRLSSARLLKEIPEISLKIESGSLNLSQMSQVQTVLRKEKKEIKNKFGTSNPFSLRDKALEVICKLENQNQKQSAVIIAQEFDLPISYEEKAKLQKDLSLKLELVFSEDETKLLEKVKALTSHQNPNQSWKDLFLILVRKELKKWEVNSADFNKEQDSSKKIQIDLTCCAEDKEVITNTQHKAAPLEKSTVTFTLFLATLSQDDIGTGLKPKNIKTGLEFKNKSPRKHLSIKLKRKLFSQANFQCQHVDPLSQQRCSGTHFLQIDHTLPLAKGGTNDFPNLRILCQAHNLQSARDWGLN